MRLPRGRQLLQRRLKFSEPERARLFFGEFRVDLRDAPVDRFHVGFDPFSPLSSAILIGLPHFETEDVTQHILALAGVLLRELIGFAL